MLVKNVKLFIYGIILVVLILPPVFMACDFAIDFFK